LTLPLDGVDAILSLQIKAVVKTAASFFDLGGNLKGFETKLTQNTEVENEDCIK